MIRKVKRALIMAAGKGERLRPLTLSTPKPLITVHGQPMIENLIETLRQKGIEEMKVVVGYLKEKFFYLEKKYPGVTLVENPYYETCNNISSLYVLRDFLEDCMILDADQLIYNEEIVNTSFEHSCYCCFWQEQETKEWLLELRDHVVVGCRRDGGKTGWQLHSVSFWTKEDGKQLKKDVEDLFVRQGRKDIYWDDIALHVRPENYRLRIRPISPGDLREIDSLEELMEIDEFYKELRQDYEKNQGE